MFAVHEEYLVDGQGRRKAVVLPLDEWEKIVEALDELEDVRDYDEAKRRPSEPVDVEQAVEDIRREQAR